MRDHIVCVATIAIDARDLPRDTAGQKVPPPARFAISAVSPMPSDANALTGQCVGIGWHGGHCGYCESCRRGDFLTCRVAGQITGINRDGGYADYMIAHAGTVALIPDELSAADAAPIMCAGI